MTRPVRTKSLVSMLGVVALGVTFAMTACGGDDDDGDGGDSSNGGSTTAGGGTTTGPTGGTVATGGTTTAGGAQGFANQRKNTAPSAR